jgi:hypothetical protein
MTVTPATADLQAQFPPFADSARDRAKDPRVATAVAADACRAA